MKETRKGFFSIHLSLVIFFKYETDVARESSNYPGIIKGCTEIIVEGPDMDEDWPLNSIFFKSEDGL